MITELSLGRMHQKKITDYFLAPSSGDAVVSNSAAAKLYTVCSLECDGAHTCQRCLQPVHSICGNPTGDAEGYGAPVLCLNCL